MCYATHTDMSNATHVICKETIFKSKGVVEGYPVKVDIDTLHYRTAGG